MVDDISALNEHFAIADHIRFEMSHGGLVLAEIANKQATATLALQGGHVMNFQPRKQEPVLWLSKFGHISEKKGKNVRGGIPICWPWFGPHAIDADKPRHGFARQRLWEVVETRVVEGATRIALELKSLPLEVQLIVTVGTQLDVKLVTHNRGDESFTLTEALHSYFNVSDITQVVIRGLEGCHYIDKVDHAQRKVQTGGVVISAETDRVYVDTVADCVIEDPKLKRGIRIAKQGSHSTVVWNPWAEKAKSLDDFSAMSYLGMVCVETANAADNAVILAGGSEHCLHAVISVESL